MTGKELKEFAARLQDEATVEHKSEDNYGGVTWGELRPDALRAVLPATTPKPEAEVAQCRLFGESIA